jgi:transposase
MNVRKFFCDNNECKRTIFTERIPSVLASYARRTHRLANQQQRVAFALGGEAGASLLTIMDTTASPDTLLRLIHSTPEPEVKTPRVLGVDDWAKRKGQSYGTILVDLEAHRPVDLLPDRSAESFAKWLKEHPGVEVISRDRGSEYIKGATDGAPDAIQVADRWHLLTNLRDALKRLLEGKRACLRAAAEESKQNESAQEKTSSTHIEQTEKVIELTKAEKQKLERRGKRQERYEAVKELHEHGVSKSAIARRLELDWRTVNKYVKADECPVYPERARSSKLAPYMGYMIQRWESGCHNATQIWREIRKQGFNGSRRIVSEWATKKRKSMQSSGSDPVPEKIIPWSVSRASWLLVKQEEKLTGDDKAALERMKQADEEVAQAYTLGQRFAGMIRERQSESLLPWLEDGGQKWDWWTDGVR